MYNFISKKSIIDSFKKSKHFKVNLGHSMSVDKNGDRKFQINNKDRFVKFYHSKYKVTPLTEGTIGQLNFFTDHYIKEDIVVVFSAESDYVFPYEQIKRDKDGIDSYLGSLIREIEFINSEKKREQESEKEREKERSSVSYDNSSGGISKGKGDSNTLTEAPGAVSWEDIQAHYKSKKNI